MGNIRPEQSHRLSRWLRPRLTVICGGLTLVGVFLAASEAAARVDDWRRFGVPLSNPYTSLEDLLVRDSLGTHARPGAVFKQFRIDSLGFRRKASADSRLAPRPLVIATGASETFGLYETPGRD